MSGLAENLLDLMRPELEAMIDARVGETLRAFELDTWMTTERAAEYLHTTPTALAMRARRGTIPAHKDGHRWLFRRDELDASVRG